MENKKPMSLVAYSYPTWYYFFASRRADSFWMEFLLKHVSGADNEASTVAIKKYTTRLLTLKRP
jgi:hypothetical protein